MTDLFDSPLKLGALVVMLFGLAALAWVLMSGRDEGDVDDVLDDPAADTAADEQTAPVGSSPRDASRDEEASWAEPAATSAATVLDVEPDPRHALPTKDEQGEKTTAPAAAESTAVPERHDKSADVGDFTGPAELTDSDADVLASPVPVDVQAVAADPGVKNSGDGTAVDPDPSDRDSRDAAVTEPTVATVHPDRADLLDEGMSPSDYLRWVYRRRVTNPGQHLSPTHVPVADASAGAGQGQAPSSASPGGDGATAATSFDEIVAGHVPPTARSAADDVDRPNRFAGLGGRLRSRRAAKVLPQTQRVPVEPQDDTELRELERARREAQDLAREVERLVQAEADAEARQAKADAESQSRASDRLDKADRDRRDVQSRETARRAAEQRRLSEARLRQEAAKAELKRREAARRARHDDEVLVGEAVTQLHDQLERGGDRRDLVTQLVVSRGEDDSAVSHVANDLPEALPPLALRDV